jgi:hypothetical protein
MVTYSGWFTQLTDSIIQINSIKIYQDLSSSIIEKLDNNLSSIQIINWMRNQTLEAFSAQYNKSLQSGVINNAIRRWNEFIITSLFCEIALNINKKTQSCMVIVPLQNSELQTEKLSESSSRFWGLFRNNGLIPEQTPTKIETCKNQVFIPNPDYIICVLKNKEDYISIQPILEQQAREPNSSTLYDFLKGKLQLEEFKAAVSLKTSNRPDRRYQPLFEAATLKAMGYALQHNWQYYIVASVLSPTDSTIFSTAIAPHSIALEQNVKLIDDICQVTSKEDLVRLLEAALKP